MRSVVPWMCALTIGCAAAPGPQSEPQPQPAPPTPSEEEPATFEGTVGSTTVERSAGVATVTGVRTGPQEGYDRVVFELSGPLPGYHVAYVDSPQHRCGSGDEVRLAGDAWLEVRLTPARMHTEAGEATVTDRSRTLGYDNLVALESTCDFEGYVTWVIAVGAPEPYRVLELADPPRIVVDVAHAGAAASE